MPDIWTEGIAFGRPLRLRLRYDRIGQRTKSLTAKGLRRLA